MPINFSTSTGFFLWRPACWLRVTGEDAGAFLQGQFTNDLRALASTRGVYGLWLTVKGKVLADSFVLAGGSPGEYWVGSYFSPAAVVRHRLEGHVIADDVIITDETESWAGLCVLGEEANALLAEAPRAALVFSGRRHRGPAAEWMYPVAAGEPAWAAARWASGRRIESGERDRLRIAAGIPAVPADIGPNDLPNEGGLETDAISYTKGCYLGQEVMARLKSMGQIRRRLVRVRGTGAEPPACPAPVFTEARQVGELRSAVRDGAAGWIGLALVSRLQVAPGAALALAAGGPPALQLEEAP